MAPEADHELLGAEAIRFAEANLRKIKVDAGGWEIEYDDPRTGEKWLLDYPQSEYHGGGPARLRKIGDSRRRAAN